MKRVTEKRSHILYDEVSDFTWKRTFKRTKTFMSLWSIQEDLKTLFFVPPCRPWHEQVLAALAQSFLPEANIKVPAKTTAAEGGHFAVTPYQLGGFVGHMLAIESELRNFSNNSKGSPLAVLFVRDAFAGLPHRILTVYSRIDISEMKQNIAAEFFQGLAAGAKRGSLDSDGNLKHATDASPVYLALYVNRNALPDFQNFRALHTWLLSRIGPHARDLARIQKLCERIGLKIAPRGRPRKIPT